MPRTKIPVWKRDGRKTLVLTLTGTERCQEKDKYPSYHDMLDFLNILKDKLKNFKKECVCGGGEL